LKCSRKGQTFHAVSGVSRILPYFDWVLYLDADVIVSNSAAKIESILEGAVASHEDMVARWPGLHKHSDPVFIVQDGMEINSGGFLVRGRRHAHLSRRILDRWWALKDATLWSVHEQGALMAAVMEYAVLYTGFRRRVGIDPHILCLSARSYWHYCGCFWSWMARMGLPLGARSIGGIVFASSPVRFSRTEGLRTRSFPQFTDSLSHFDEEGYADLRLEFTEKSVHQSHYPLHDPFYSLPAKAGNSRLAYKPAGHLRGFNLLNAVWTDDLAWYQHPAQLWVPTDFAVHVTTTPQFVEIYRQYTDVIQDEFKRHCPAGAAWLVHPHTSGPPSPEALWDIQHLGDGNLTFTYKYPNRWRGYVHEDHVTCVPAHAFVETVKGVVVPSAYEHPRLCTPRDIGVMDGVDGHAAVALGPYHAPGFQEARRAYYSGPDFARKPCDPRLDVHLLMRVVLNVTGIKDWPMPSYSITEDVQKGVSIYVYYVLDVAISPWEHIPSRLFDVLAAELSDELQYRFLLTALLRTPELMRCMAPVRDQPLKGPRWYVNTTDPVYSHLLPRERFAAPYTIVFLPGSKITGYTWAGSAGRDPAAKMT
jgi:hypothetical protein